MNSPTGDELPPAWSWPRYKGVAATFAVIALVIAAAFYAISQIESVAVSAACENIPGGYSCLISGDNKNATSLGVCWSINRVCENGQKSSAKKCQSVYLAPGKSAKAILANAEFENNEKCDKVSAFSVENVSAGSPTFTYDASKSK